MSDAGTAATNSLRPRRSVLYMPGANARALEKAKGLDADSLILDLEDAVAPDAKAEARDQVVAAVASGEYGHREVTIRVNGLDTEWHADDLAAASAAGPAAVVVPKVNSPADVAAIEAGLERGGAPEHTKIWAMVETPQAMLDCATIAGASERLTVLVMGTNDLAKELHAQHVPGRQPLITGLGLCLLAARATGQKQGGQPLLGGLDVTVNRNYFGRQVDSFETLLSVPALGEPPIRAVFIRAPAITELGPDVESLATVAGRDGETLHVAVRQGPILATAFHPELTDDLRWHALFVEMVQAGVDVPSP